ncbi:hypothetical protein [Streptomyces sp. NPDC053048]|uniref:hypothetical protein n=1 Tax=Streptomyces sp. NPDC053048 TaxID=3365694 RepID=UPI0037D8AA14
MSPSQAPSPQQTVARSGDYRAGAVLKGLGGVALWVLAGLTFFFLPMSVMASDGCSETDPRVICTVAGQQAVVLVPLVASPVAAVLGTWGVASRRESGWVAWLLATLMLGAAWVVVACITA